MNIMMITLSVLFSFEIFSQEIKKKDCTFLGTFKSQTCNNCTLIAMECDNRIGFLKQEGLLNSVTYQTISSNGVISPGKNMGPLKRDEFLELLELRNNNFISFLENGLNINEKDFQTASEGEVCIYVDTPPQLFSFKEGGCSRKMCLGVVKCSTSSSVYKSTEVCPADPNGNCPTATECAKSDAIKYEEPTNSKAPGQTIIRKSNAKEE